MSLCERMMEHVSFSSSVPPPSFANGACKDIAPFPLAKVFSFFHFISAMPRIIHDPTKDECPSYDDEDFEAVRELIIAGHQGQIALTNDGAVEKLKTAWQKAQEKKVASWNEQVLQDQTAREDEERIEKELEAQRLQEKEKEDEDARREAERKKPKINDFDPDLVVPGHITPHPSSYALNKIKNLQYVELDYFTIKGCNKALLECEMTSNHDTLGLTR